MWAISVIYALALTISCVQGQHDIEKLEVTIGTPLSYIAVRQPKAEALVEVRWDGSEGRCQTYAELA